MGSHGNYDALVPLAEFPSTMKQGKTSYIEPNPSDAPALSHRVSIDSTGSIRINEDEKSSSNRERRKLVIGRDRATAFRYFFQFHLIPFAVAVLLIVLNLKSQFLGPESQWINLLQFAAKLHEILMQISIATAMIGYQQYLLTQSTSAVPFGAIFSAYYATQVGYLWSPEFRASVTTPRFPLLLKTGFALFVAGSILLASGVGPASAIAMLPRLINYSVKDYDLGLDHAYSEIFPTEFTQPGATLEAEFLNINEQSPALGWEYLRNLPSIGQDQATLFGIQTIVQDLGNGYGEAVFTMPPLYPVDLPTVVRGAIASFYTFTRTLYVQYAPNGTVATVQQVPVAAGLYMAAGASLMDVHYQATTGEAKINITHPFFPITYLNATDAAGVNTVPYTNITRQQLWSQNQGHSQGQIIWVDDVSFSTGRTLGAIVVQPDLCDNGQKYLSASACAVSGLWTNITSRMSQTTLTNSSGSYDQRAESLVSIDFLNNLPPTSWQANAVSVSKEWANSITTQISNQNRTVADNLLRALLLTENICPVNGSYPLEDTSSRPMMHEALISALVANGMSHATGPFQMSDIRESNGDFQWPNINDTQYKPAASIFTFQGNVVGYAWNMDGTGIKIALPILLIYCLYVTIYVVYTLVTGHSSRAWDTIASITALAFNSRPSKVLENTSVGISETDTFRNLVSVQEVDERRLEMVFQRDEQDRAGLLRRVRPGKAYS